METCSIDLSCQTTASFVRKEGKNGKRLILLLHGYEQHGRYILNLFEDRFSEEDIILAPNGPFPLPKKRENGFKVVHAWYFYDPYQNYYFVDMTLAVTYIKTLVKSLGYEELPTYVIGFSQGGYLAPFVGQELLCRQVTVLHARYRSEVLGQLPFTIHAVHGVKDTVVDGERARECHRELLQAGNQGEFHLLPNVGHVICSRTIETTMSLHRPCE